MASGIYSTHMMERIARRAVRELYRRGELGSAAPLAGGWAGGDPVGAARKKERMDGGDGGVGITASASEALPATGIDFSDESLPEMVFANFEDRFGNFELNVGVRFVGAMNGVEGHRHTGSPGDAPRLPATSVLLPTGSVTHGATLEDHLRDTAAHGGGGSGLLFDDFEQDDQDSRWLNPYPGFTNERPSRVAEPGTGNHGWRVPVRNVYRAKGDRGYTFNRNVYVRFLVAFPMTASERTMEVVFRSREHGTNSYSYVCGVSSSRPCYLGERDNALWSTERHVEGVMLPNNGQFHEVECALIEDRLLLKAGGVTRTWALPRQDGRSAGHLEFWFLADPYCTVDDLCIARLGFSGMEPHAATHHANGTDPLDLSDLADRNQILQNGQPPGRHAATHGADGLDPIDVADLRDLTGRLLTPEARSALTEGGNADAWHTHAGLLQLTDQPPPPNARSSAAGTSDAPARADHRHAVPCWTIDYYLSEELTEGYLPTDADFDTAPRATRRRTYVPTLGGEFRWNGYGSGLYLRAALPVRNHGDEVTVPFLLPSLRGSLAFWMRDSTGTTLLHAQPNGSSRLNVVVDVPFRAGEVTTLLIYAASVHEDGRFWVTPAGGTGDMFSELLRYAG